MNKINNRTTGTKLLALLLVVVMMASLLPMTVFADLFAVQEKAEEKSGDTDFDRIIMLDCGRKYFTAGWIKALIVEAHEAGYTQLQLNFGNDGLRFLLDDMTFTANGTTYSHETVVSRVEAGNMAQNSSGDERWLTQTEMDGIIACAVANDIEIVPMLNLPGHANAILNIDISLKFMTSASTLDVVNNEEAREFALAILNKYVTYFKDKGCKYFNFGADEYANDLGDDNPYLPNLQPEQYQTLVDFIGSMSDKVKSAGMTPRCFNDALYFTKFTSSATFSDSINDIQCCYWSSGWGSYPVASASTIAGKGHEMINTNGDYYYVLGKGDEFDSGYSFASGFSNTAFMGSTINNPVGSMFCIWCDFPNAETEQEVAQKVRMPLRAMAARMQGDSIDGLSTNVVAGGFNADGSINNNTVGDSAASGTVSGNNITLTVGDTHTIDFADTVTFATGADESIASTALVQNPTQAASVTRVYSIQSGHKYLITTDEGKVVTSNTSDNGYNGSYPGAAGLLIQDKDDLDADNIANLNSSAWTITENDGMYSVVSADGQYLKISASTNNVTLTSTPTYLTIGTSSGKFSFSANNGYLNDFGGSHTFASSWNQNDNGSKWRLYEIVEESAGGSTLTVNALGEGTTTVTLNDGTVYNITVNAKSFTENKALAIDNTLTLPTGATNVKVTSGTPYVQVTGTTVKGVATGTAVLTFETLNSAGKVTARYTYNINVSEEDLTQVDPITIEYWITNQKVTDGAATPTQLTKVLNASDAGIYSAGGVEFSKLVDERPTSGSKEYVLWKGWLLPTGSHQSDGGSDMTQSENGKLIERIRYYNGSWQYFDGTTWADIKDTDQLVAYYMQRTQVTQEIATSVVDWGETYKSWKDIYPGSNWFWDGYVEDGSRFVFLDYQVVYEDQSKNPTEFPNDNTWFFHFDKCSASNPRVIGLSLFENSSKYEIYKITVTESNGQSTGYSSPSTFTYTYNDTTETVVWDAEEDGGEPRVESLSYTTNRTGKLIRIYVRTVATQDTLTVKYLDMSKANGDKSKATEFYSYNIAVKENTLFNEGFDNYGNGLVNNKVTNYYGVEQIVQSDLSMMPQIGAQYRYAKYTLVDADRSEDGKTVMIYYTFNNTADFVIDFGLPLKFKLTDISESLGGANITKVELSSPEYGTATCTDNNTIIYTPNKILQANESFGVEITGNISYTDENGQTVTSTGTVTFIVYIIPASTVYYEDSFASFTNGKDSASGAQWANTGTEKNNVYQALSKLGDSTLFGYDDAYNNGTVYSMGSAKYVTVTSAMAESWNDSTSAWPYATFKFTGTGFDLISLTDNNSGLITYEVYIVDANGNVGDRVMSKVVNNYYGYTFANGEWTQTNDPNALYQIPVVKVSNLTYGTYFVKVSVAYGEFFDKTGDSQYSFWLDGVRVYNTRGEDYEYYGDKESYPQFIELHDALVSSGDNYQAVLIEGKTAAELTEYTNIGPNHEVYLAPDQSIAFKLSDISNVATVQLGAKAVDGTAKYKVNNGTENTLATATDMYYDITAAAKNGTVIITNTGNTILSLTTVKVTFTVNVEVTLSMTAAEAQQAVYAVRAMYAMPVEPAEPFEPEYLSAKFSPALVVQGKTATLTVTASEDVEAICVDGEIIETYKARTVTTGWGANRTTVTYHIFTYSVTADETADYSISAFNADGAESEAITATLTVWMGLGNWFKDIIGRFF